MILKYNRNFQQYLVGFVKIGKWHLCKMLNLKVNIRDTMHAFQIKKKQIIFETCIMIRLTLSVNLNCVLILITLCIDLGYFT